MQHSQEIIDLQSEIEVENIIKFSQNYYFGSFALQLNQSLLKLQFEFKRHLVSTDLENEELEMIARQQYQLTKPMELLISWAELSPNIKKNFASLKVFACFLKDQISNPKSIEVDREKLTIKLEDKVPIHLYFSVYKKIQKTELVEDMKKLHDTFSKFSQQDMGLLDPDLLLAAGTTFNQEDTLKMLIDDSENDQESSDSNASKEQQQNSQNNTNLINDKTEPDNQTAEIFGSQFKFSDLNNPNRLQTVAKQNDIPIYQRFRGFNINIPRKQKMRVAEKMLRIGYCKEEIIRFFSGGAEQMQNQDNRLPDYRNPQAARYKQIHLLVAKRQHARHNELLRRHGLTPIQQLPEYSRQIINNKPQLTDERKVREIMISYIKAKRFKKLDQIYQQMKRNGVETTLAFLKIILQQLKQKTRQKKAQLMKNEPNREPVIIN